MTLRKWTPSTGTGFGIATQVIAGAIKDWTDRWFVNTECPVGRPSTKVEPGSITGFPREAVFEIGRVAMFASSQTLDAIADRAIGVPTARFVQNDLSREVLVALGRDIASDLAATIDRRLSEKTGAPSSGQDGVALSDDTTVEVDISASWLSGLSASLHLPPMPHVAASLESNFEGTLGGRLRSIDPQKIRLIACLGTAVLPIGQVLELQLGDVIPLDSRLEDNLALHLSETDSVVAFGEPCADDAGISFQVKTFINRLKLMTHPQSDIVVSDLQFAAPRPEQPSDVHARVNPGVLDQLPVSVSAMLGEATMTVKALRELKEGDVVRLGTVTDGAVSIVLNGTIIALGEIVAVDQNFGVRISRIGSQ